MTYRILADAVFSLHLLFVVFVVAGGFLLLYSRKWVWFHLPAVAWSAWIEFADWICPLTPLENWLRRKGGQEGFQSSFIEEYLMPLLYPGMLTRRLQIGLGLVVLGANALIYWYVFHRLHKKRRQHARS